MSSIISFFQVNGNRSRKFRIKANHTEDNSDLIVGCRTINSEIDLSKFVNLTINCKLKIKTSIKPKVLRSNLALRIFLFLTDTGLCGALRAMRIFAIDFFSKREKRSRKRHGAKCPRKGHTVLWPTFFPILYRLNIVLHMIN